MIKHPLKFPLAEIRVVDAVVKERIDGEDEWMRVQKYMHDLRHAFNDYAKHMPSMGCGTKRKKDLCVCGLDDKLQALGFPRTFGPAFPQSSAK